MNFNHTDDRRMLADSLGRYVAEQYSFEARMRIAQSPQGYCTKQWATFAELGAIGALLDEDCGGYGGAGFDIAVVFEALGRGLVVEPFLASAILAGSAIAHCGNATQRAMLGGIMNGTTLATLAHDDADQTHATHPTPTDTSWLLNGHKTVVAWGEQAQTLIVSARTSGVADDAQGLSLFMVPTDTPGVTARGYQTVDGGRAADIQLTDVRLPAHALLGELGQGAATLEHAIGRGILALCAESLGAMEAAKQATIDYLQTRKQFGVPIGSFQALQHRMADVLIEIEQARSAVINAAAALDADRLTRERALSAAKYSIGRIGILVAETCIQLHGGIGMTWELPLAHYAKRLVMIDHQLGDEDHHLARFIALGAQSSVA